MFTQDDLRELAAYQAETPIVSVYLNVDPTERTTDEYRLALRKMLKDAQTTAATEDIDAVEQFFDHEYDWSGRGVAVFSGQEEDFWRTYSLAVPVPSMVTVDRTPYVVPLAALVDTYGSYMVALVDHQEVQLFLFEMGELKASDKHTGEEIRKLKRGRGSSNGHGGRGGAPISSQHEEEAIRRNLREAVQATKKFWKKHEPRHLIIAGSDPTITQFQEALSKQLQEKIIGTFNADMTATDHEIRKHSLGILKKTEEKRASDVVDAVFTAAAKGQSGVIRLADTLSAAHEGRIQTLVIAQGYRAAGYQCQNCDYITDQALETCPFCSGDFVQIPDAAEALVAKVIGDGGKVEVVDGDQHPKVEKFGVGALLRY